ncbi:hypothetical protein PG987_007177 [Apiospora arundinis]
MTTMMTMATWPGTPDAESLFMTNREARKTAYAWLSRGSQDVSWATGSMISLYGPYGPRAAFHMLCRLVLSPPGGHDHQERMLQLLNSVEGRLLSQDPEMVNGDQNLR